MNGKPFDSCPVCGWRALGEECWEDPLRRRQYCSSIGLCWGMPALRRAALFRGIREIGSSW